MRTIALLVASAALAACAAAAPVTLAHAATVADGAVASRVAVVRTAAPLALCAADSITHLSMITPSSHVASTAQLQARADTVPGCRPHVAAPVPADTMSPRLSVAPRSRPRAPGNGGLPLTGLFLVGMTALAGERDTPRRDNRTLNYPVGAAKKIFAGSLVTLNATGFAQPGATATTLTAVGRALATVDNTAGADGALHIDVERGLFRFANSAAGDQIALTEVGKTCYVVDDQTVAKTTGTGTRSAAGIVRDVDAAGVWVEI